VTSVRIAEARRAPPSFGPQEGERVPELPAHPRAGPCCDLARDQMSRILRHEADQEQQRSGTRYGEALALMADNRPVDAEKILDKLTETA